MLAPSHSLAQSASHQNPARCSSPTKRLHACIFKDCRQIAARVAAHKWRQDHPPGTLLHGLPPKEHPRAVSDNLDWRLFSWICDSCMRTWYSYKYYLAVNEDEPTSQDLAPLPEAIFKPLPSIPPSAAPTPEGDDSATSFANPSNDFPMRSSSLSYTTWPTSDQFMPNLDPMIQMDFPLAPISESANLAGAMATAQYQGGGGSSSGIAYFDQHQYNKHFSAPDLPVEALDKMDEDVADRRRSEPVMLDPNAGMMGSSNNNNLKKTTKRGGNFDHENYVHMRRIGACPDCQSKRRKCDPSHPRFDLSGASTPQQ